MGNAESGSEGGTVKRAREVDEEKGSDAAIFETPPPRTTCTLTPAFLARMIGGLVKFMPPMSELHIDAARHSLARLLASFCANPTAFWTSDKDSLIAMGTGGAVIKLCNEKGSTCFVGKLILSTYVDIRGDVSFRGNVGIEMEMQNIAANAGFAIPVHFLFQCMKSNKLGEQGVKGSLLLMPRLTGTTLEVVMKDPKTPFARKRALLAVAIRRVQALHSQLNMVQGDLHLSNLWVRDPAVDEVIILDFGGAMTVRPSVMKTAKWMDWTMLLISVFTSLQSHLSGLTSAQHTEMVGMVRRAMFGTSVKEEDQLRAQYVSKVFFGGVAETLPPLPTDKASEASEASEAAEASEASEASAVSAVSAKELAIREEVSQFRKLRQKTLTRPTDTEMVVVQQGKVKITFPPSCVPLAGGETDTTRMIR